MKKIAHLLGIMMIGFLITACVQEQRPPHVMEPVQHGVRPQVGYSQVGHPQGVPLQSFNQIVISGDVSGTVNGGQSQDQLLVNGTAQSLKHFSAETKRGILYIHSSAPVNISLSLARSVRELANSSNGQIEIRNIANQSTKLGLSGHGVTSLKGNLVLSRVDISDNATLHAYWVDSSNLHVVAQNNAKLFLAGIVTNLDIIATGDAEVDAKYLRADNAYVRTTDDADVGVTVSRSLSTLSTAHSTVYYYDNSRVGLHYLGDHGTALRMKGIPNSAIYKNP